MRISTILTVLMLIATACKKNSNEVKNSFAPNKCEGRYDRENFSTIKMHADVPYGKALNIAGVQEDLLMDVYEPEIDTAKKRVMIIFVHGGGWVARGKDDGKEFCTLFAKKRVCSCFYRL